MKMTTLLLPTLLAGCAVPTLSGLKQRAPLFNRDSDRTVEAIGSCIAAPDKSQHITSYTPTPTGATISIQNPVLGGATPWLTANIEDQGAHRHVTIWTSRYVPQRDRQRIGSCL